jgi:hypothetical protein
MRKVILCLAVCLTAGPCAFAQVGILTDDPQGMFHVDPRGDTVVTPTDTLNAGDDVIVTLEGNVGIGLLPEATSPHSLTLTGGGTPSAPHSPLRIEDGNQREGRILTSDANGRGTWKDLPAGFNTGRVYGLQGIPAMSISAPTTVFTFSADVAGQYLFEIRWWSKFANTMHEPTFVVFNLYRGAANNNNRQDSFEQYLGGNLIDVNTVTLCFTLYASATAGETLILQCQSSVVRTSGGVGVASATQVSPAWTQAKVNVLRVN